MFYEIKKQNYLHHRRVDARMKENILYTIELQPKRIRGEEERQNKGRKGEIEDSRKKCCPSDKHFFLYHKKDPTKGHERGRYLAFF